MSVDTIAEDEVNRATANLQISSAIIVANRCQDPVKKKIVRDGILLNKNFKWSVFYQDQNRGLYSTIGMVHLEGVFGSRIRCHHRIYQV
ncbi:hypothetical protein DICPUDRAFT_158169 [Dictyostelium purpureum]|uniref:Uncharacterized protein n=1 Tax=Dictyostelium purpureum TaxID=5786 RepID=F1A101_DICPU|nr:uncharacterized protein DICPUDRAFT_158169 [Dictyostelium purpureum]EGC30133.1 hypothetical protein DICPUDRAFT_158169 [Dictyostelium purpureum]|eukprot:XP_003293341.1 hypothetical protein DICPUDRAFT_158169 [Dictyostelium purpureum]